MERALKLEVASPACDNPAGTHLNLCAILSQLGRHKQAAEHAKSAVRLLEFEASTTSTSRAALLGPLESGDDEPLLPTLGPGTRPTALSVDIHPGPSAASGAAGTSVLAIACPAAPDTFALNVQRFLIRKTNRSKVAQ